MLLSDNRPGARISMCMHLRRQACVVCFKHNTRRLRAWHMCLRVCVRLRLFLCILARILGPAETVLASREQWIRRKVEPILRGDDKNALFSGCFQG
jgi:hypothetical protein